MIPDPGAQCRFGRMPFIGDTDAGKFPPIAELEDGSQFRLWWKFAFREQLPNRF
jgi:hypothetical protein